MEFDLKGHLNSLNLSTSKALWPLFEAIVNSIQSIEDSPNREQGQITIVAEREFQVQSEIDKRVVLGKFDSFSITDNGIGFDSGNFDSFRTACSTYKIQKGCKGIGRFLWLKAFESVDITSTFQENGKYYKRVFRFSAENGITPEINNCSLIEDESISTTVTLNNFFTKYRTSAPVELEVVAKKIIEHCLPFFISGNCPKIILVDNMSPPIDLNRYYDSIIKDSLHQDHFSIKDASFIIYHLRMPEGTDAHKLHLCADLQEVESIELKNYIPDLRKKIIPADDPTGFYYVGYISSPYLNSIANSTRTAFDYDENDAQISITGTGKESLISSSLEFIRAYLADYLIDVAKKKREQIDGFVAADRPTYRFFLNKCPEVYEQIPAGLKSDELELELHKQVQAWERRVKEHGVKIEKAIKEQDDTQNANISTLFNQYWAEITDLSKTCLAEYVTRRKAILTLLEDALTIQDDGHFKREDIIHSIICPMRHTSNDVSFEEMNLWIVDERLAYHRFLASDKTIKSLPDVESKSTKEVDIAVFDRAFAYSEDEAPLNTITIVEFKKPDNTKDNPLSQMGGYIDEIVSGRKKRGNGLSFGDCSRTCFRCYAICDMTPKMERVCKDAGMRPTPDGMGYYGYQPARNAYFEAISYNKLLSDAKKRNQILFDKLFSPRISEVIHQDVG